MNSNSNTPFALAGEIEIKPFAETRLSEIYSSGHQVAFVNSANEQCHPMVLCKDFLLEAVHAHIHKMEMGIYGFNYKYGVNPSLDFQFTVEDTGKKNKKTKEPVENVTVVGRTRIMAANASDNNFSNLQVNVADFLHQFENRLGLDLTQIYKVTNPQDKYKKCGVFVYVSSPRWMEAPPMLSLYSLLMRVGCVHKIGDNWLTTLENVANGTVAPYQANDGNYVKRSLNKIKQIMEIGYRTMFYKNPLKNYPKQIPVSVLHNSTGIVALSQNQTNTIVKHWTREDLGKKPTLDARRKEKPVDAMAGV